MSRISAWSLWCLLLSLGYALALWHGHLQPLAGVAVALLLVAGIATSRPRLRIAGHALFIALALALGAHWLPGFDNARMVNAIRLDADAVPFTLFLNQDKPLIGFWLLLVCPWVLGRRSRSLFTVTALLLTTVVAVLAAGYLLGVVAWSPKWPGLLWLWAANNLLLVCIVEELFFRGYLQEGLTRLLRHHHGATLVSLLVPTALFGLAHAGAGWQWALLAAAAGLGYGLCYRAGGLTAAVLAHFGLNLSHLLLFSYPALQVA